MRLASLSIAALLVACSGKVIDPSPASGDAGPSTSTGPSGVASERTLDSLTDAEKRKLCDWVAASLGGYGAKKTCGGDVAVSAPEDAAECMRTLPPCDVKVAEVEACLKAWSSSDGCSLDFTRDPACKAMERCEDEDPPPVPDEDGGAFSPAPDEIP